MAIDPKSLGPGDRFNLHTGEAIRAWAHAENSLWHLTEMLLGCDQFRARIIMASIPVGRPRRELLIRLGETYLDPVALPKFRRLMRRIGRVGARRNIIAHGQIHVGVKPSENVLLADEFSEEMDGGLDFTVTPLPTNELKTVAKAANDLHRDIIMFMFDHHMHVHALPRKSREQQARHAQESGDPPPEHPAELQPPPGS